MSSNKRPLALCAMLLTMAACTNDHDFITDDTPSHAVSYRVEEVADYDTASTRGVVSSVADLTTIEAYAFKSDGTQYIGTESSGASLKYDSSTGKVSVLSGAARWPEDGSCAHVPRPDAQRRRVREGQERHQQGSLVHDGFASGEGRGHRHPLCRETVGYGDLIRRSRAVAVQAPPLPHTLWQPELSGEQP